MILIHLLPYPGSSQTVVAPKKAKPAVVRRILGEGPLIHENQLLYLPVSLGGRRTQWFVLDTGSYRSYLTKRGYGRLKANGLRPRRDGEFGPFEAKVAGVSLGKALFAFRPEEMPVSLDPDSDGVIGLDLLQGTRLGVDVAAGRVRVWPAKTPASAASRDWFPPKAKPLSTGMWSPGDGGFYVMIGLANLKLPACVDTGCEESYLARELAPALRPSLSAGTGKATFYTGVEDIRYYRIPRVGLEGLWISLATPVGATNLPNTAAILGVDALEGLRVLFDFPGGRLHYTPLKPPAKPIPVARGLDVALPTHVTIRWPLGEVVRVEPGCDYELPEGYREVKRPDGTVDLVPPGMEAPAFKVKPRLLVAPTVYGRACPVDCPTLVPPKTAYTVPPGWRVVRRKDGRVELHPPSP